MGFGNVRRLVKEASEKVGSFDRSAKISKKLIKEAGENTDTWGKIFRDHAGDITLQDAENIGKKINVQSDLKVVRDDIIKKSNEKSSRLKAKYKDITPEQRRRIIAERSEGARYGKDASDSFSDLAERIETKSNGSTTNFKDRYEERSKMSNQEMKNRRIKGKTEAEIRKRRASVLEDMSKDGIDLAGDSQKIDLEIERRMSEKKKEMIKGHIEKNKNTTNTKSPAGGNKSAEKKTMDRDNFVYKMAAMGVGGGLVLSMANTGGQQSNAQLYGQQY